MTGVCEERTMERHRRRGLLLFGFVVILTFWLLVLAMLPPQAWSATTYYAVPVDQSQNTSCQAATNSTTPVGGVVTAAGCLSSGDTLILKDGTYSECLPDVIPSGLDNDHHTVLQAENRRRAIINGTVGGPCGENVIFLGQNNSSASSARHYITLRGIVIDVGQQIASAVQAWGGTFNFDSTLNTAASYLLFDDIEMTGIVDTGSISEFGVGFPQGGGHHLTVRNSRFHHLGATRTANPGPQGCVTYAFYAAGDGNLFENNEFDHNCGYVIHAYSTGGGWANNIFRGNYAHENGGAFIMGCGSNASKPNYIYNNVIARESGLGTAGGGQWGGITFGPSCSGAHTDGNYIYNNTIVLTRASGGGAPTTLGCISLSNSDGAYAGDNKVRNNLCAYTVPAAAEGIWNTSAGAGTNQLDHNLCSTSGPNCAIVGDPLFRDTIPDSDLTDAGITKESFQLRAGSPAINAGVNTDSGGIIIDTDAGGNPRRVGQQDIGAWEFGSSVTPPPPPDPIAWWKFEEATGTTAADATGNGHDLSLTTPMWGGGRVGSGALACNGTGGVATTSALGGLTNYSWVAWVLPQASPTQTQTEVIFENGGYFGLAWSHTSANFRQAAYHHESGGAFDALQVPLPLLPGVQWVHLATTYDGSTLRLYKNGVQVAVLSGIPFQWTASGTFTLCGQGAGTTPWAGRIDEVKVWGRALSATEVGSEVTAAKKAVRHTVVVQ
jgi:hypothetical protein